MKILVPIKIIRKMRGNCKNVWKTLGSMAGKPKTELSSEHALKGDYGYIRQRTLDVAYHIYHVCYMI